MKLNVICELNQPPTNIDNIDGFSPDDLMDLDMRGIHRNTLIKFIDNNKKELYEVPGYCMKWGDFVMSGIAELWEEHATPYKVHFNTSKLKPFPFNRDSDITGWGYWGGETLDQKQVAELIKRYNDGEELNVATMTNVVRSIIPGVYKSEDNSAGHTTEMIINVPCRMTKA